MHELYGVIFRLFVFLIMYARSLERVWALKRASVDNKPEIISLERVWAVKRARVWCRTFSMARSMRTASEVTSLTASRSRAGLVGTPLNSVHLAVGHQLHGDVSVRRLLLKKFQQQVEGQLRGVSSMVQAVVPSLQVVVGADVPSVDAPGFRG